jgi:hypothetical protein
MRQRLYDKCVDLLGRGSRLVNMTKPEGGRGWYLVPGREITEDVAQKLIARPDVFAEGDALFPGMTQTHRMRP